VADGRAAGLGPEELEQEVLRVPPERVGVADGGNTDARGGRCCGTGTLCTGTPRRGTYACIGEGVRDDNSGMSI
jgi:hypothetical protein